MGSPVGVFSDKEVKGLHKKDKARLRAHVVRHILSSAEIRRIIHANPKLLTRDPRVRKILRTKAGALHRRLKKKKKK
jgi:hypothetical protein